MINNIVACWDISVVCLVGYISVMSSSFTTNLFIGVEIFRLSVVNYVVKLRLRNM